MRQISEINCGKRADILCISNTGNPADRMISKKSIFNSSFYPFIKELWFPREASTHNKNYPSDYTDKSVDILLTNNLIDRKVIVFSEQINVFVYNLLKEESEASFKCPSTGFFGIIYSLIDLRFRNHSKYLLGFDFSGTDWHPWDSERRIIVGLSSARQDLQYIENKI